MRVRCSFCCMFLLWYNKAWIWVYCGVESKYSCVGVLLGKLMAKFNLISVCLTTAAYLTCNAFSCWLLPILILTNKQSCRICLVLFDVEKPKVWGST